MIDFDCANLFFKFGAIRMWQRKCDNYILEVILVGADRLWWGPGVGSKYNFFLSLDLGKWLKKFIHGNMLI